VGFQQWAITWGILIMFFICYGCSYINGSASFRLPWGLQMIPAMLLFVGLIVLPESPRWLAKKDRWEEAQEVLTLVHGRGDPNSPFVMQEMSDIREVVEFERNNADVSYFELFKPRMINRTIIGLFTQIWSQLTGMNVMVSSRFVYQLSLHSIQPSLGVGLCWEVVGASLVMARDSFPRHSQ
jgi:hypothetical protein